MNWPMQLSVLPEGSLGLAFQLEREEFYIVLSYDENRYHHGAHGDMRLPNVAVRLEGQHVRFLDFDWAGVAGEHTYPPFMNPEIKWPSGAHTYAVMLSEHDVALLQLQFDLALQ